MPETTKTRVRVYDVLRWRQKLAEVNLLNLADIEWVDDEGKVIPCPTEVIDRFRITGLANMNLVEFCFDDQLARFEFPAPLAPKQENP